MSAEIFHKGNESIKVPSTTILQLTSRLGKVKEAVNAWMEGPFEEPIPHSQSDLSPSMRRARRYLARNNLHTPEAVLDKFAEEDREERAKAFGETPSRESPRQPTPFYKRILLRG